MFHEDHDGGAGANQIHGSSHSVELLAGNQPVGEVPLGGDLHSADAGHVEMLSADDSEGDGGLEGGASGDGADGFLSGVDQVGVLVAGLGVVAHSQYSVFALQHDLHVLRQELGHEGRNAHPQIAVHSASELLHCPLHDRLSHLLRLLRLRVLRRHLHVPSVQHQLLDSLLQALAEDQPVHEDPRNVDLVRVHLSRLHDLLHFRDHRVASVAHIRIEVARCVLEVQIPIQIRLLSFNKRVVRTDGLLHNVGPFAEHTSSSPGSQIQRLLRSFLV